MRLADNHKGWNVEYYHKANGWTPITEIPYVTRQAAELALWVTWPGEFEYRIYEAI